MLGFFVKVKRLRSTVVAGLGILSLIAATSSADAADAQTRELGPSKGRAYYESRGDAIWDAPGGEKVIALTFDDGPDPADTPQILDLLKQYEAKATFFVMGRKAKEYPDIVKREVMEGHEIANHTFSHRMLLRCTERQIRSEIEGAQESILSVAGIRPKLFRPPEGFFDARVVAIGREQGLTTILWSWHHPTDDWARPGVHHIVKGIMGDVRGGDIILLHDYVHGQTQTIAALKQVLPKLKESGYRMVTVSELLRIKSSQINVSNR